MNHFQKHTPNFARDPRDEPEPKIPFSNLKELMELKQVKIMTTIQLHGKDFYRFSQAENKLMAEYDNGFHWWVVGYFDNPIEGLLDSPGEVLPEWKARYRTKERGEIPQESVYSTCGDQITLKDGTVLTRDGK